MNSENERLCMERLGEDHGRIFIALWWETINQFYFFRAYQDLFGDPAFCGRLNAFAPIFLGNLQQLMMRDMIARICRLTDPATERNGLKNLSLRQLESFSIGRDGYGVELRDLLVVLESNAGTLRKYRNKFGSHNDLPHVLGTVRLKIEPHLGMIEQCTLGLLEIINTVEREFELPVTDFHESQLAYNDYTTFRDFLERSLPSN